MSKRLVAKADHDVTITHTVERMPIHYPIRAGEDDDLFDYTGGDPDEFDECAEIEERDGQLVFWGDDGNEYLQSEIEVIEDKDV